MGRKRDNGGQYVRERDPSDLLDAMDSLEPYTTGELAKIVGWPQRSTFDVLDRIADEGLVQKKKPDPRRVIWIRPTD